MDPKHLKAVMPRLSRIALKDGYEYRYLLLAVCKSLKSRFNSFICVYVQSEDAYRELVPYVEQSYIDKIKKMPQWKDFALKPVSDDEAQAVFDRAIDNERLLGITYNQVRMTRRDAGLGFYLGAYCHPRSTVSELTSYLQIVKAYNLLFDFWKKELKDEQISLVLNGLKEEEVVSHAFHIPFRYLFCTRIENYFYWTRHLFCEFPEVKQHYDRLMNTSFSSVTLEKPFFLDITHRKQILSAQPWSRFLKKVYALVCDHAYRLLKRRYLKSYYFKSFLKFLWKEYRDMRKLSYPNVSRLSDITGKKCIYFPLAAEPEMSLHWMSPEYTVQLAAIQSIARDLPADTLLVVKEAMYGVGKRSDEFYDHIRRLKNTVLLDIRESGLAVIAAVEAVATISGTSGLEAAIMGKPVILFGRHNYYDFLDHVFLVKQDEQLKPAIQAALNGGFDKLKAVEDGARLRQAAINASFDLKTFTNIHRKQFDESVIHNVVEGLLLSLVDQSF